MNAYKYTVDEKRLAQKKIIGQFEMKMGHNLKMGH